MSMQGGGFGFKMGRLEAYVQRLCQNQLTPDELNKITQNVLKNISVSDATKFTNVPYWKNPLPITPTQENIIKNLMNSLPPDDPVSKKANNLFNNAIHNGSVKVK